MNREQILHTNIKPGYKGTLDTPRECVVMFQKLSGDIPFPISEGFTGHSDITNHARNEAINNE